jgi:signal transduction histidine kinase
VNPSPGSFAPVIQMRIPLLNRLGALLARATGLRTVRLRLTLLYGGLFLACGAGLVAITYLLVRHAGVTTTHTYGPIRAATTSGAHDAPLPKLPSLGQLQRQDLARQHASDVHQLLVWSVVALAVMTVASIALGWLLAGRVLSPLRRMTATTRRISQENLHQRLALAGPVDELKELSDTIDGLLGRLEAAFEAQRRFVANASHELRTPLARIRTALDVAIGKPAPVPEVRELDRKVREGLDRADRLLESFLALSRAQHGELGDRTVVSLSEVVRTTLQAHEREIAEKRIDVERDLRPATLSGSATLLSRMVENLIDNAIRHNTASGWIRVEVKSSHDLARLTVDSGGHQLDQSTVHDLAQPFMRLGGERTGSVNGVGLGLSIVQAIATAHAGTLMLQARPQGGLRVVVELPCATEAVQAEPAA